MIHVTQPSLAPLEEFTDLLRDVWNRGILTHNGPLVRQLESELCAKLSIPNCTLVSNGTIAIQMAIKALGLSGSGSEIITTPFTWVATVSAIQWEGCKPVFCDIEPDTFNIDPRKIEECITSNTAAIMPVHVFGNPCDVSAIATIAKRNNLKVIYDAAHAIGSHVDGRSLLEYGDISATSLHATKILNTAEGGACIARDPVIHEKLKRIRFFGHNEQKEIVEEGCNGKMTEVHAALGIANLKYFDAVLEDRKRKHFLYKELLKGTCLIFQNHRVGKSNYSYFPVVFPNESALLDAEQKLNASAIFPRRYFHPSVNVYKSIIPESRPVPLAEDLASRILCLPLYWKLADADIHKIAKILRTM